MVPTAIFIPARCNQDAAQIEKTIAACKKSNYDVYVLTDNNTIAKRATEAGAEVYIDKEEYTNNTEICSGAINSRRFSDYKYFISVDYNFADVRVDMIEKAKAMLKYYPISTLTSDTKITGPEISKLVRAGDKVLWCSRTMEGYGEPQLDIYGFRYDSLGMFLHLNKHLEEHSECLEQLRWLKNGWEIGVLPVAYNPTTRNDNG